MDFTILAIDDSTRQLHLDQPVEVLTGCVWFVNNMQVEVETADGDVLGLEICFSAIDAFPKLSRSIRR